MTTAHARHHRLVLVGAAGLLAVAGLSGCSQGSEETAAPSSSTTASASATATGDVCAQADSVRASLSALVGTSILQEGTTTLKDRFATFESEVQGLLAAAQSQFATETDAVRTSVATLKGALAGLAESPSVAEAAAIKPALDSVKSSTEALLTAVQNAC